MVTKKMENILTKISKINMGIFNDFFKKHFNIKDFSRTEENINDWADAITTGWEYTCNLFLTTPKICLENDGLVLDTLKKPELFGEPNKLGTNGEPSGKYGCWIRRHGHEEEFEALANISENMMYARQSEIGRIPPKSKLEIDFKKFLIDFRDIVESSSEVRVKIFKINNILRFKSDFNNKTYQSLLSKSNFPEDFFKQKLCSLNGVNSKISGLLWSAGYLSPEDVLKAKDNELLKIKEIDLDFIKLLRK